MDSPPRTEQRPHRRRRRGEFRRPPSELSAARSATVLVPLTHVGLIRATGADAARFPAQPADQRRQAPRAASGAAQQPVQRQGPHAGEFPRSGARVPTTCCSCRATCIPRS
ncbi:MAG: hypothetical protein MZW92_26570 [Comamonadaceae bacterium]|nr:hypothetical protein [Comamonadaceae bacterium]